MDSYPVSQSVYEPNASNLPIVTPVFAQAQMQSQLLTNTGTFGQSPTQQSNALFSFPSDPNQFAFTQGTKELESELHAI